MHEAELFYVMVDGRAPRNDSGAAQDLTSACGVTRIVARLSARRHRRGAGVAQVVALAWHRRGMIPGRGRWLEGKEPDPESNEARAPSFVAVAQRRTRPVVGQQQQYRLSTKTDGDAERWCMVLTGSASGTCLLLSRL